MRLSNGQQMIIFQALAEAARCEELWESLEDDPSREDQKRLAEAMGKMYQALGAAKQVIPVRTDDMTTDSDFWDRVAQDMCP